MKALYLFLYCFLLLNIYNITALDVDAGRFSNNEQARQVCPKVCSGKGMTWKGQWRPKTEDDNYNALVGVGGSLWVC